MILSKVYHKDWKASPIFIYENFHFPFSFRNLSSTYDEVFLAEVVNVFQPFTILAKKCSAIAVRHNPRYDSDIFLTIFTAVLLDCLK